MHNLVGSRYAVPGLHEGAVEVIVVRWRDAERGLHLADIPHLDLETHSRLCRRLGGICCACDVGTDDNALAIHNEARNEDIVVRKLVQARRLKLHIALVNKSLDNLLVGIAGITVGVDILLEVVLVEVALRPLIAVRLVDIVVISILRHRAKVPEHLLVRGLHADDHAIVHNLGSDVERAVGLLHRKGLNRHLSELSISLIASLCVDTKEEDVVIGIHRQRREHRLLNDTIIDILDHILRKGLTHRGSLLAQLLKHRSDDILLACELLDLVLLVDDAHIVTHALSRRYGKGHCRTRNIRHIDHKVHLRKRTIDRRHRRHLLATSTCNECHKCHKIKFKCFHTIIV